MNRTTILTIILGILSVAAIVLAITLREQVPSISTIAATDSAIVYVIPTNLFEYSYYPDVEDHRLIISTQDKQSAILDLSLLSVSNIQLFFDMWWAELPADGSAKQFTPNLETCPYLEVTLDSGYLSQPRNANLVVERIKCIDSLLTVTELEEFSAVQ